MQKIGVVSQKGGVGKSTLAAMTAVAYALAGWKVLVADMDVSQGSLVEWNSFRKKNKIIPIVDVATFNRVGDVFDHADYDIVVFDGAPHASQLTKEIADICDLVLLPTGCSIMDLNPQIRLAHELTDEHIVAKKILFVLMKIGSNKSENEEVLAYLKNTGYQIAKGGIPEKTSFRKAFREGKTLTEVTFPSLKRACEEVMQSIVNRSNYLTK